VYPRRDEIGCGPHLLVISQGQITGWSQRCPPDFRDECLPKKRQMWEMPLLWEGAANHRASPTPFALKGELCARNNSTPIDDFSGMNWSCCAASASLAAALLLACR
jgi:hypothetical protein